MNPSLIRTLIAIFFIAHGLIHTALTIAPPANATTPRMAYWPALWHTDTDPAWLAVKLGLNVGFIRLAGTLLVVGAALSFLLTALGLLGVPGLNVIWQPLGFAAGLCSLLCFVFFWHPWFVAGAALSAASLALIVWQWPAALFVTR